MTETRIIDGKPQQVHVLPPIAARGSQTAEEWAAKRKQKSSARRSRLVRDHILRFGRPVL